MAKVFILFPLFILSCILINGQNPNRPPSEIQVYAIQELAFGSFITGFSGGTVTITPQGNRFVTGTITGLSVSMGSAALFEVKMVPGRTIHILLPEFAQLTRIGGEEIMTISNFSSDRGNNFVTSSGNPFINPVNIGAVLNVGAANPPGDYTGTFTVNFMQE